MISNEQREQLRKWAQWGLDVENRSRARAATVQSGSTHVAVVGVRSPTSELLFLDGLMRLRAVVEPPGPVHLAGKSKHGDGYLLAMARHLSHVTAEIAFFEDPRDPMDAPLRHGLCWHAMALLKLRRHHLHSPASSSLPWDLVAAAAEGTVDFELLDDKPAQIRLRAPSEVSADDVAWVDAHYMTALELRGTQVSRRFGLAFNLAYTWNLTDDYRVALTLLWAGLEALFGDQNDHPVTANLAGRIGAWCPSISDAQARALYKTRCDAVHGRELSTQAAQEAMSDTERLLREALVRAIEQKLVPLPDW